MNSVNLVVGIRPVSYKTRSDSLHFYNYPSTIINIYYNHNNKIASICKNGDSCLRNTTTLNQLQVFLGSGTLSSGSIDYIRSTSHNSTYKNATINFSL